MSEGVHGELNGCPPAAALDAIARGEPAADAGVAAHVETCLPCARFVEEVRKNTEFLRGVAVAHLARTATHSPATRRPRAGARGAGSPARGIEEIGGYRLVKEIGRGGQGVIYEAVQEDTKRKVAIKMLLLGRTSERQRIRFEREAEIAGSLRHPGLVTIYESVQLSDGRRAMVMEFVEGQRLDRWVEGCRPRGPIGRETSRRLVAVMAEVCDAVDHAHRHGVIHRDLKPGNIVVGDGDQPRVLDFGLARRGERGEEAMLTKTGAFEGTPAYSSPEQVTGDPDLVDSRTDVYTLGVILYELLTGRLPYPIEGALIDVVKSITEAAPVRPGRIDEELWTIVVKAMAKERERRYQSAGDLREDLRRYLAGEAINAKRDSTWYLLKKTTSKHRGKVAAAGVAAVLGVAGILKLALLTTDLSFANESLSQRRDELEEALDKSQIVNARSMVQKGDAANAERELYARLAGRMGPEQRVERVAFEGSESQKRAAWALAEFAATQSSIGAVNLQAPPESAFEIHKDPSGHEPFLVVNRANHEVWRVSRERPVASEFASVLPPGAWVGLVGPSGLVGLFVENRLRVFSAGTGLEVHPLASVTFSPGSHEQSSMPKLGADGSVLVVSGSGRVHVHGVDGSVRELQPENSHLGRFGTQLSVDGKRAWLLSADERAIEQVDLASGDVLVRTQLPEALLEKGQLTTRSAARLLGLAISEDESLMAVTAHSRLFFRDLTGEGGEWREPESGSDSAIGVQVSADGRIASVLAAYSGAVRIFDTRTGKPLRRFSGHSLPIGGYRLSRDGKRLATSDNLGLVRVYNTTEDDWRRPLGMSETGVPGLAMIGENLVGGANSGAVLAWSPGTVVKHAAVMSSSVISATGTADGTVCAIVAADGQMGVAKYEHGELHGLTFWRGTETKLTGAAVSPDGKLLATAGELAPVTLWDTATREPIETIRGDVGRVSRAPFVIFSPNGHRLVWSEREVVYVRNMRTGGMERELKGHMAQVRVACFSRDGSLLATGGDDRAICIWDTATWKCRAKLSGSQEKLSALAFGPSGNLLYSGDFSSSLRVWDVGSAVDLAEFDVDGGILFGLQVSDDGKRIAVATQMGDAQLWDLSVLFDVVEANRAAVTEAAMRKLQ